MFTGYIGFGKPSSFTEPGPTGGDGVNAVSALMEGAGRQLVGAGLGMGGFRPPCTSSSGTAGSLHCSAAVVLWLPK